MPIPAFAPVDSPEDEMGSPFVAFSSPCADGDLDASGDGVEVVAVVETELGLELVVELEVELELELEPGTDGTVTLK